MSWLSKTIDKYKNKTKYLGNQAGEYANKSLKSINDAIKNIDSEKIKEKLRNIDTTALSNKASELSNQTHSIIQDKIGKTNLKSYITKKRISVAAVAFILLIGIGVLSATSNEDNRSPIAQDSNKATKYSENKDIGKIISDNKQKLEQILKEFLPRGNYTNADLQTIIQPSLMKLFPPFTGSHYTDYNCIMAGLKSQYGAEAIEFIWWGTKTAKDKEFDKKLTDAINSKGLQKEYDEWATHAGRFFIEKDKSNKIYNSCIKPN